MKISKVKDWIKNNRPQFRHMKLMLDKYIVDVIRLSDERIVRSGWFYEFSKEVEGCKYESVKFMIYEFNPDLIHVKYEITFIKNGRKDTNSVNGECEINKIIFSSCDRKVLMVIGLNLHFTNN